MGKIDEGASVSAVRTSGDSSCTRIGLIDFQLVLSHRKESFSCTKPREGEPDRGEPAGISRSSRSTDEATEVSADGSKGSGSSTFSSSGASSTGTKDNFSGST